MLFTFKKKKFPTLPIKDPLTHVQQLQAKLMYCTVKMGLKDLDFKKELDELKVSLMHNINIPKRKIKKYLVPTQNVKL